MRQATELEFLQYFYDRASYAMGPADGDVYDMIKQDFMDNYNCTLPEGYGKDE